MGKTQQFVPPDRLLRSFVGKKGLLSIFDGRADQVKVTVRVRNARFIFGTRLELQVEPILGVGRCWVTYRLYNRSAKDLKAFSPKLVLEERKPWLE